MEIKKPPEDPGGPRVSSTGTERRESLLKQPVSYPTLPSAPKHVERPAFTPADLPLAVPRGGQPSIRKTPSSSSLRSNATANLRKKSSLSSLKGINTPPMSPRSRRQSANLPNGSGILASPRSSLAPAVVEEPIPIAPEDFAREAFEAEIRAAQAGSPSSTELVVVIHDACYGHRFSRPRTSKASLSTIVERPERVLAIVRGISMAYVRLGGRHAGGQYAPDPRQALPPIPFHIKKSTRVVPLESAPVIQVHGQEWMQELNSMCNIAEERLAMDGRELIRPLDPGSNSQAKPMLHEGDLYLCKDSLDSMQGALGGVCDAVDAVFEEGHPRRAFACVRPPGHHCSSDFPSGFCWLNNVHVGIAYSMQTHGLTHAAIIDFDLHHGDGSQEIAWAHNAKVNCMHKNAALSKKNPIGYFSLHDINSYPCESGDIDKVQSASLCIENAHGQSIWNVHLQPWKTEAEFWGLYESRYILLLEKMRTFLRSHSERLELAKKASQGKATGRSPDIPNPRAAIFISAGFDASEWEGAGMQRHKVNVPTDFYARFTRDIVRLADEEDLGVGGRVISVLEGGYSDRALSSGIFSHLCGLTAKMKPNAQPDLVDQMADLSVVQSDHSQNGNVSGPCQETNFRWWSPANLDEFDAASQPTAPLPSPGPRKPRTNNPTYITPTRASAAKTLPPRRSLPASQKPAPKEPSPPPRPPTPPPPDPVGWAVAAQVLARLLIPDDRQTTSCKPEELAPPRQRRQRQSDIGVFRPESSASVASNATVEVKRAGLRERKTKPKYQSDDEEEAKPKKTSSRVPSRANRRKTMGGPKASPVKAQSPALDTDLISPVDGPRMPLSAGHPMSMDEEEKQMPLSAGPTFAPSFFGHDLSDQHLAQPQFAQNNAAGTMNQAGELSSEGRTETMDGLASGMKKMSIKLNVPAKEEHDKRERERDFERLRGQFSL